MKHIPSVLWFFCLLAALLSTTARALPVEGLYTEEVAVANQSESERVRAYREALERVLLKVSGQRRYLEENRVRTALGNAANFVEEVSYRTGTRTLSAEELADAPAGQPARVQQAYINVRFARDLIDGLLQDADIPIWDQDRPTVLLWVTVQDENGRRSLLGSSSDHPALDHVQAFSRQRAIPLLIPILDLTDRRALPVDQAWRLDVEQIRAASERYGADSILAGRMLQTGSGEFAGLWQFIFRDETQRFDHFAGSVAEFMEEPLDRVTVQLSSHFALDRNVLGREAELTLRIDGVREITTYASVLEYLQGLSVVRDVHVSRLQEDRVELRLRVNGGATHLAEFISLGRDLEPVNFELGNVQSDLLHYRWTR